MNTALHDALRDHFALNAPREIAPWFEPVMPPAPAEPQFEALPSPAYRKCTPEEVKERQDRRQAQREVLQQHRQELEAWETEREKQRALQWPWAWADGMLKARAR